jgi:hypothetical protein
MGVTVRRSARESSRGIWAKDFSQLAAARQAVQFTEPRVRIGHLDTGYDLGHDLLPKHLLRDLGRSFVEADRSHDSAVDPNNEVFLLDNASQRLTPPLPTNLSRYSSHKTNGGWT